MIENCPVDNCEDCEFHRSVSWCAKAIPKHKEIDDVYKARMEGFWDGYGHAYDEYKLLSENYDKKSDYIIQLEEILTLCYVNGRAPSANEIMIIDNFWNGEE